MTIAERNNKLKHFITCLKCGVSGKPCDVNCSIQYEAGNMGEIVENLEAISKALEQEPILDKIKAEIEQAANKQFKIAMGIADLNERYTHIQMENAYRHSLNIIDKYRGESDCRECKAEYDCYDCKKYIESEEV